MYKTERDNVAQSLNVEISDEVRERAVAQCRGRRSRSGHPTAPLSTFSVATVLPRGRAPCGAQDLNDLVGHVCRAVLFAHYDKPHVPIARTHLSEVIGKRWPNHKQKTKLPQVRARHALHAELLRWNQRGRQRRQRGPLGDEVHAQGWQRVAGDEFEAVTPC